MTSSPQSLSVLILTHNEANHIERAIKSVREIALDIFIVDSGSTDGTVEIATANGAHVLRNPWTNYAQQFQWGLDNAPITTDWVMRLDADEIIEDDLRAELADALQATPPAVTGINLKRKHVFMGRWIKHGGRYPLVLLRVWRTGVGRIEQRWMDEHMLLSEGQTITLNGGFSDHNLNDLTFFTDKHNKYATREAVDIINQRRKLFARDESLGEASVQATRKRAAKENFYNNLPFAMGPLCYFLYRYFVQRGFLDGVEGAIYHGLQGFWYRFLVDAKVVELERELKGVADPTLQTRRLAELTGLKLPTA